MKTSNRRTSLTLGACALGAFLMTSAAPAVSADEGGVSFYNKNGGARDGNKCMPPFTTCLDRVCSLSSRAQRVNFKSTKSCKNNSARSAVIHGPLKAGWTMRVYDDESGKTNDDWTEIRLLQDLPTIHNVAVVGTFEWSYRDYSVLVKHHRKNGLDGKVSRVEIEPAQPVSAGTPSPSRETRRRGDQ
jgi:hypothetical protein